MDQMTKDLLDLLDRIETEEDSPLAAQRFDIAERYGYVVSFDEAQT